MKRIKTFFSEVMLEFSWFRASQGKCGQNWAEYGQKWCLKCLAASEMQSFFCRSFSLDFSSGKFAEIQAKFFASPKICLLLHLWVQQQFPSVRVFGSIHVPSTSHLSWVLPSRHVGLQKTPLVCFLHVFRATSTVSALQEHAVAGQNRVQELCLGLDSLWRFWRHPLNVWSLRLCVHFRGTA